MSVQGKQRKQFDNSLYVGLFEAEVVAFNPSREELEKLLDTELEKDPEYLKEDEKDGVQTMRLSVWLKEVKNSKLFNLRFFLKDKERMNKNEDKNQYINSIGITSWADDPSNLPEWFTAGDRAFRKAKVGEEELYNFVRNWLSDLDYKDPDTKLDMEWAKLMRGNVKPLTENIGSPFEKHIVALATVKTGEDSEGKPKDYQQVYNRTFLPEYAMKFIRVGGKKIPKAVTKFYEQVEDPEYGCKEFFGLELKELHEYNPEENIATADTTAISDDGPDVN